MIWWLFPVAAVVFGLTFLLSGIARFAKLKMFSGLMRFVGGGFVLAAAALVAMIGLNLQTYARLTHEEVIAYVDLKQLGPQQYTATIRLANQEEGKELDVRGDQIRFEAQVIKWEPWANIIGYDAVYSLDRMDGRYIVVEDQIAAGENATVYSLREELELERGLDVYKLINSNSRWLQTIVDAHYGSGTFVPMADNASYEIKITQDALIARPANAEARNALLGRRPTPRN